MKEGVKKRKIVFLARLFYPHVGGVEKHVYELSQQFIREGYAVTVVTEQYSKELPLVETVDGIDVRRVPRGASEFLKKIPIWWWVIKNRALLAGFDVIHVHDVFFWLLPILCGIKRRSVFITFHGYEGYPVRLRHKILRKIAELYCSGSMCVGEFMKKWYWARPDIITYGATTMSKLSPKKALHPFSAVFFGRLDQQTGISEYYQAYRLLRKKYRRFRFAVIGEGEYGAKINDITVSSFKSDVEKDIQNNRFIFVSRYLSMLEAMVQKRLVVAVYTDPVKRDYLLQSPFSKFIEVCDSHKSVSRSIEHYIAHPEDEKKKVEAAYAWAINQTWEKMADNYRTLWRL